MLRRCIDDLSGAVLERGSGQLTEPGVVAFERDLDQPRSLERRFLVRRLHLVVGLVKP